MRKRTPIRILVREIERARLAAVFHDIPCLTVEQQDKVKAHFGIFWDSWIAPKLEDLKEHDRSVRRKLAGGEA